jgi:hypothetical protein
MGFANSTPNAQDLFSRIMVEAYDEKSIIGVPTAGQAFFGRTENGSNTIFSPNSNVIDIDIVRGNEKIAALVPRGTVSRHLGSLQKNTRVEQGSSFSRKYPLAIEEGDIGAEQLTNRLMGENPYANTTKQERLRALASKQHTENMRRMIRLFEVLAWQSLLTGKQDAILGTSNTDLQYDFRRNAAHTTTVGTAWSTITADILGDIDTACFKIRQNGKMIPDMMTLGSTAMDGFIKNTEVKSEADNRRYELIEVSTNNPVPPRYARFVEAGLIPRGRLRTPKGFSLWMFTYIDNYTNDAGTAVKYLADDLVLINSSDARADRYFGPDETLPSIPMRDMFYTQMFGISPNANPIPPNVKNPGAIIRPEMFYCDAYASNDWMRVTARTQSAPIFATTATDGFAVLDTAP